MNAFKYETSMRISNVHDDNYQQFSQLNMVSKAIDKTREYKPGNASTIETYPWYMERGEDLGSISEASLHLEDSATIRSYKTKIWYQ